MDRVTSCPKCGTAPRPAARFCDSCGAALPVPSHRAEYKHATILFVDVVRSMDIASQAGAERLREIMTQLVNTCVDIVTSYEGIVDAFTGDGIMALFGTPVALEDHAQRACLAALRIQEAAAEMSAHTVETDGFALMLRVGINSGEIVAGESGITAMGYTVTGAHVGFAQRMESAAAPGGVLVSESTAQLVEHVVELGDRELFQIKGFRDKVPARRLVGRSSARGRQHESALVGREDEVGRLRGLLDGAIDARAAAVSIVGPAGIGKSRLARELAYMARERAVDVVVAHCESHARRIPFHAGTGFLRAILGLASLQADASRARLRVIFGGADPSDVSLLEDLLGIGDVRADLAEVSPDARRRRLTTLIEQYLTARAAPALYIVEDVHWIDDSSEALLADVVGLLAATPTLVVLTYRPEYRGILATGHETPIRLSGLADDRMSDLVATALGSDSSVSALSAQICERAAGNPFFAEEIVRELAQRGVLTGGPGDYACESGTLAVSVPPTLHAAIAARVDRLEPAAKQALYCAAVIGARFDADLVGTVMDIDEPGTLSALVDCELIERCAVAAPRAEYTFRHPLIQSVAYASQLKSERAALHRRFADVIEHREPAAADRNAALIAEHLHAAGDAGAALGWHMRAGTWSATRDIRAARMSWARARLAADAVPADTPGVVALRIMPRALLCATAWRVGRSIDDEGFEELQQLAGSSEDRMARTLVTVLHAADLYRHCRFRDAARLASDVVAAVEEISDADSAIRLLSGAVTFKIHVGDLGELAAISERVIELAGDDPARGHLGNGAVASPLAVGVMTRGVARAALGRDGWREDLTQAVSIARSFDLTSRAMVTSFVHGVAISQGWLLATAAALREADEIVGLAENFGDDLALGCAQVGRLVIVLHLDEPNRSPGLQDIAAVRDIAQRVGVGPWVPLIDILTAKRTASGGDGAGAVIGLRTLVRDLREQGEMGWRSLATELLAELLLRHGGVAGLDEAATAIDDLAALTRARGAIAYDPPVLRLRALLAQSDGDHVAARDMTRQYLDSATKLGFEGHMAAAASMWAQYAGDDPN